MSAKFISVSKWGLVARESWPPLSPKPCLARIVDGDEVIYESRHMRATEHATEVLDENFYGLQWFSTEWIGVTHVIPIEIFDIGDLDWNHVEFLGLDDGGGES